jgi:hypothetical protein
VEVREIMNQITSSYESRTDLALEASESLRGTEEADSGILMEEEYKQAKNLRITSVRITTKEAERVVGKPKGTYITLESSELLYADEDIYNVQRTVKYFSKNDEIGIYTFNKNGVATAKITNTSTKANIEAKGNKIIGLPMGNYRLL